MQSNFKNYIIVFPNGNVMIKKGGGDKYDLTFCNSLCVNVWEGDMK